MLTSPDRNEGRPPSEVVVTVTGISGRTVLFSEKGPSGSVDLPLPQIDLVNRLLSENDNLQLTIYRERQTRGRVRPRRGLVIARVGAIEDEGQLKFWFNEPLRSLGRETEVEEINYINDEIFFRLKEGAVQRDFDWMWDSLRRYPIEEETSETAKAESLSQSGIDQEEADMWFAKQRRRGTSKPGMEALERMHDIDKRSREK